MSQGDLIVCEGGPYHGWWWWLTDWHTRRQAAINMGYTVGHPAAAALGYEITRARRDHPSHPGDASWSGTVTRWTL